MRLNSGNGELLRDRNTRLLLGVTLVAGFGTSAMSLAASVWTLSLTSSASLAALCGLCIYAPSVVGPLIGAVVDRLPRQRLLIVTNAAMGMLLLTLIAVRGRAELWLIFGVMLGYGTSLTLIDAGESAIVQAVVPAGSLGRINSLRISIQEGMKLVAPLVGAALFTWAGGSAVAVLAAVALLVSAGCYALVHVGRSPARPRVGGLVRDTVDGLRFLFGQPTLRTVVVVAAVAVGLSGLGTAASFVVITADLHRPPAFAGVLAAAQGAGSILGGLVCPRMVERRGEQSTAGWGATLFAAGTAALCLPWTVTVALGRLLTGVGLPWTVIAAFTAVQRRTGEEMIGRAAASAGTAIFAPVAATISLGAWLVTVLDHRVVLLAAAGGTLVAAAAGRVRPVPPAAAAVAAE